MRNFKNISLTVSSGECQDQSQLGGETSSPWDPTCQCCQRSSSCSQPSSLQRRGGTCPGWRYSSCWSSSSLRIWIGSEIGRESSEDSERSEVSHSHLEFSDIPSNSPSKFYFLPAGSSHRCWRGINCITDCGFKRLGWVAWQPTFLICVSLRVCFVVSSWDWRSVLTFCRSIIPLTRISCCLLAKITVRLSSRLPPLTSPAVAQ